MYVMTTPYDRAEIQQREQHLYSAYVHTYVVSHTKNNFNALSCVRFLHRATLFIFTASLTQSSIMPSMYVCISSSSGYNPFVALVFSPSLCWCYDTVIHCGVCTCVCTGVESAPRCSNVLIASSLLPRVVSSALRITDTSRFANMSFNCATSSSRTFTGGCDTFAAA